MPLYSDHYYYGSGQPPPYYLPSSPYTTSSSRISSPYSLSYMSPVSVMLSAGIGSNPLPRGLRSYSPMLSSISETSSPLMSRRDIGNHRSSPRHLAGKTFYRQPRHVVIDTDNLDLSRRKKDDDEQTESTPGMISRKKTIVRMHTKKLKENPELKKRKTQAEILMEKYFIKEKPVKEEEMPRRKRIWEEREEELNNTLAPSGTIKRSNTVLKKLSIPVPCEVDVPEKPEEIIPPRKMSIDSELLKEEEALLDCMIQEELGLSNQKEMNVKDSGSKMYLDNSNTPPTRKTKVKREQIPYGRKKSSHDLLLDESGVIISKRKSHVRRKKTSKNLPLDEANTDEILPSDLVDIKDDTKINKRRTTRKKKPLKFKIDSLHVEEKSSPKMLRKFQYEVIVEDGNTGDKRPMKHINELNKEDIPMNDKPILSMSESNTKDDLYRKSNLEGHVNVAGITISDDNCDKKCDTLTTNLLNKDENLSNARCDTDIVHNFVDNNTGSEKDNIFEKKTEKVVNKLATKGFLERRLNTEIQNEKSAPKQEIFKKTKTDGVKLKPIDNRIENSRDKVEEDNIQEKIKDIKLVLNQEAMYKTTPEDKNNNKSPQLISKSAARQIKQESLNVLPQGHEKIDISTAASNHTVESKDQDNFSKSELNENNSEDSQKFAVLSKTLDDKILKMTNNEDIQNSVTSKKTLDEKVSTLKQKSLTPEFGRKKLTDITPRSDPNTPIMSKKQILPGSNLNKIQLNFERSYEKDAPKTLVTKGFPVKTDKTLESGNLSTVISDGVHKTSKQDEGNIQTLGKTEGPQLKNVLANKQIKGKPQLLKTEDKKITDRDLKGQEVDTKKEDEGYLKDKLTEITVSNKCILDKDGNDQTDVRTNKSSAEVKKLIPPAFVVKKEDKSLVSKKGLVTSDSKNSQKTEDIEDMIKDKVINLNVEINKNLLDKEDKIDISEILSKDKLTATKLKDNLDAAKSNTSINNSLNNIQSEEKQVKKEPQTKINKSAETSVDNKSTVLKKCEFVSPKELSEVKGTVNPEDKKELHKEKVIQLQSDRNKILSDKMSKVEKIIGKDIVNKSTIVDPQKESINEISSKNNQWKEELIKKKTGVKTEKSTEIILDVNQTVIPKEENVKDLGLKKVTIIEGKKGTKDTNILLPRKDDKSSLIAAGKHNTTNTEKVISNNDKITTSKTENVITIPNMEDESNKLLHNNEQSEKVTTKKVETTKIEQNLQISNTPLASAKDLKINKNQETLKDNLFGGTKSDDSVDKKDKKIVNSEGNKDNVGKTTIKDAIKQSDVKIKDVSPQLKPPTAMPKTQEKFAIATKAKDNKAVSSLTQQIKTNDKESKLSSKSEVQNLFEITKSDNSQPCLDKADETIFGSESSKDQMDKTMVGDVIKQSETKLKDVKQLKPPTAMLKTHEKLGNATKLKDDMDTSAKNADQLPKSNDKVTELPGKSEVRNVLHVTKSDGSQPCLDKKNEIDFDSESNKDQIDKTVVSSAIKQSEIKIKDVTKQPKPPTALPKTQEKLGNATKPKENKVVSNLTSPIDQQTKSNSKNPQLSSKLEDQTIGEKAVDLGKDKINKDEVKPIKDKKKRIKSESDVTDECVSTSDKVDNSSKETDSSNEKSKSLRENSTENNSKKKKKSKDESSSKKKKNAKSPKKMKESPKIADKEKSAIKTERSSSSTKTTVEHSEEKCSVTISNTENTTNTTTTSEENEKTSGDLSKRSTRLLHFINKCMKLSEDDDNLIIDYSDEDESSSSEYTSDSDYTSDSEEDTLTEDSSDECDVNCHRKCEKLMPNLCGVNQKLIVEALSSLRKGSSDRDHGSPTRRHSNAALSLDDDSPRHASGPGRVTPPATTIPKFRKYTMDDFQFLKVLGKGSFGKVLLAELRGTQYYYAVKCLKKDVVLEDDDVECTLIERKVLALGTNHPYLCHLFCTFQTESHLFFVMEYLNGGDLMFHIQQQGRFDEGRARFYAAEIVSGLKFLHKKGIVYRDLKLDNILLDFDGHVRIADFGMCKLQIYLDRTADTFCGTPDYMAPEIIKGLKYNQCVDWWSFGILLYEMLVGQSPFSGCDEDDLFWCICNRQPHYPRFITLEAKRILMQLLEKEASKRLGSCENGALEVMGHAFFNGLDWDRLERRELVPPFKPNVKHPLDVHYFDKHFTAERACLTPIDPSILQSMDQTQFQGFSYTNPNVTD